MPIYSFECNVCGHSFDIIQGMNDERPTECPECNEEALFRSDLCSISYGVDTKQPKTLGSLADKNTEKMVKEGLLDKEALNYESNKVEKKKKHDRMRTVSGWTDKQKKKYIMTGKEP